MALSYIGSLASLEARCVYRWVAPFSRKALAGSSARLPSYGPGVRGLPILSLITFFIGLIPRAAAYELAKFGAKAPWHGVPYHPGTRSFDHRDRVIGRSGSHRCRTWNHEGDEEIDAWKPWRSAPSFSGRTKVLAIMGMLPAHHLGQREGIPGIALGVAQPIQFCGLRPGFGRVAVSAGYHNWPVKRLMFGIRSRRRRLEGVDRWAGSRPPTTRAVVMSIFWLSCGLFLRLCSFSRAIVDHRPKTPALTRTRILRDLRVSTEPKILPASASTNARRNTGKPRRIRIRKTRFSAHSWSGNHGGADFLKDRDLARPQRRKWTRFEEDGMSFQGGALFGSMTVGETWPSFESIAIGRLHH